MIKTRVWYKEKYTRKYSPNDVHVRWFDRAKPIVDIEIFNWTFSCNIPSANCHPTDKPSAPSYPSKNHRQQVFKQRCKSVKTGQETKPHVLCVDVLNTQGFRFSSPVPWLMALGSCIWTSEYQNRLGIFKNHSNQNHQSRKITDEKEEEFVKVPRKNEWKEY